MRANFDHALKALLAPDREGGFSNHPADNGGMTNLGVTQAVWSAWVGHPASEKEMRALTPAKVAPLYRRKYWDAVAGDLLPTGLDFAVFDFAVNSGAGRAIKMLQMILSVKPDGAIGPKTLAAIASRDSSQLIEDYSASRLRYLQGLDDWSTFGKGWQRRVAEVSTQAVKLTA
jgi:lysozyme family protein